MPLTPHAEKTTMATETKTKMQWMSTLLEQVASDAFVAAYGAPMPASMQEAASMTVNPNQAAYSVEALSLIVCRFPDVERGYGYCYVASVFAGAYTRSFTSVGCATSALECLGHIIRSGS